MRTFVPLTLLLGACITEASFGDTAAGTFCRRAQECDPETFESTYGTRPECEDLWDAVGGPCFQEKCELDVNAASQFVAALGTADCDGESPIEAPEWRDVWTACTDLELLGCLLTEGLSALGGG